jgi:hypothetical protein
MTRIHNMSELTDDDRITVIGEAVMAGGKVGIIIWANDGKPDGFIDRLEARFPRLLVVDRRPGPMPNTVMLGLRRATVQ